MANTITRTGRQQATLAAGPSVVAAVLADPDQVVTLLGDLLDQRRSTAERWAVPRVRVGPASFETTLVPAFHREGDEIHIRAEATRESDVGAVLELRLGVSAAGAERSTLVTAWRFELVVPLPRLALRLAAPGLDRTVARTVQRISDRTERAVLRQREP